MRFILLTAILFAATVVSAQMPPASLIPAPADLAAPPADATRTASGLTSEVITPGTGKDHPSKDEVVTVNYTSWTADGKMFDSTVTRGKPLTIALNRVLPGFGEGVRLMVVGGTRRLWVPESLAYKGQQGKPTGMMVIDVTLLEMPTRAPADVKTPPADATWAPSGITYKVLTPGTGTRHPKGIDQVTVHYTGWTTDGKIFDSSLPRGKPSTFAVNQVIPGWTEGLKLMVEGEKARFWIPQNLAYEGKHPPFGTLVFDVELIRIE